MAQSIAIRPLFSLDRGFFRKVSVFNMFALARQRHQLANLDQRMLADIGVDESAAKAESKRPVWDVPQNWRG